MTETHFDAIAAVYDESLPAHVVEHYLEKRTRFVRRALPARPRPRRGLRHRLLTERLHAAGFHMSGADPSDGMLEILRSRAPGIEAVQAVGYLPSFRRRLLRPRLCVAVMHHVADPPKCRRRSARWSGSPARADAFSSGTTTLVTPTGAS